MKIKPVTRKRLKSESPSAFRWNYDDKHVIGETPTNPRNLSKMDKISQDRLVNHIQERINSIKQYL